MKSILGRVVGVAIALAVVGTVMTSMSFAQCAPDPSRWTVTSEPPGRTTGLPVVCYDPATGLLTTDGRGADGTAQTAGNAGEIQGDDVGLISILVTGPQHTNTLLPAFGLSGTPYNGIAWVSQYFNGRQQSIGTAVAGQYLAPDGGSVQISQYPTGLGAGDFGEVELAVNYAPNAPGGILVGSVQVVPEPAAALVLIGSVLFGFLKLRRG